MKKLIFSLFVFAAGTVNAAEWYPYVAVGVGYKIQEPDRLYYFEGQDLEPLHLTDDSALIEAGAEYGRAWSIGLKHDSQWSTGWPFNGKNEEYSKTEIFIRYKLGGRP